MILVLPIPEAGICKVQISLPHGLKFHCYTAKNVLPRAFLSIPSAPVTIGQATDNPIAQSAAATQRTNVTTLFAGRLLSSAEIYLPSDPVVTKRWTLHDRPTYFQAIRVGTEEDAVAIAGSGTQERWLVPQAGTEIEVDLRGK